MTSWGSVPANGSRFERCAGDVVALVVTLRTCFRDIGDFFSLQGTICSHRGVFGGGSAPHWTEAHSGHSTFVTRPLHLVPLSLL